MSYTRTNWVPGETPLSAENMNNIEEGIAELNSKTPSFEYQGNVFWWNNTWTCPADGFIEVRITPSGTGWYLYISDSKAPSSVGTSWSHCMNGTTTNVSSYTFFVQKGAVLGTAAINQVNACVVNYYKLK